MRNKYSKPKFLLTFCIIVAIAAAVRHIFTIDIPMREFRHVYQHGEVSYNHNHQASYTDTTIAEEIEDEENIDGEESEDISTTDADSLQNQNAGEGNMQDETSEIEDTTSCGKESEGQYSAQEQTEGDQDTCSTFTEQSAPESATGKKHNRIRGVWSYSKCFPDLQDVQIVAAQKNGITPVRNRAEAEKLVRQRSLVNITHSPYYVVDDLTHSMPYLVPKAQHMLNTIGVNFIDSCMAKGVPVHLLMVTSVLRTTDDVSRLQRGNKNATTNSCHCYGTTVDIAYNRFLPLNGGYTPKPYLLRWDEPMKRILSEVLDDLRRQGICYIKYERKQGCFHLTCR